MAASEVNAQAGIQIALTVLALAGLPISAWLYISSYVEERVDVAIQRHDRILQQTLSAQADDIDTLQTYSRQLCFQARRANPEFSCEAPSRYERRRRQR